MSPEATDLAKRQIALRFADERRHFINSWHEMARPFVPNGFNSSSFALTARVHCEGELRRRAHIAWDLIRDIIDSEGFNPSEDNRGQVRGLLDEALQAGCEDVHKIFANRVSAPYSDGKLADGQAYAADSAMAAFEVDLLRRVKRRPPLGDELSPPRYHAVRAHWRKAIELADKQPPDLPNALKEAASAVESLAQIVVGRPGLSLGEAVKQLRSQKRIPPGSDEVLAGLWTFANAAPGARHGSSLAAHVDDSHWGFARTTAEGALRLLLDLDA